MVTGSLRWTALVAVAVAALGACSGGGSAARGKDGHSARAAGSGAPSTPSSASSSSRRPAQPVGEIGQDRLQGALLGSFAGLTPITEPQNGPYASLPAAQIAASTRNRPSGAKVTPATCESALWSGPDTGAYGKAAATVVAFRKPGDTSPDGVQAWEELVASGGRSRQAALGTGPVAGCGTVTVSYRGDTLGFAERRTPALGQGSRGAVLTPSSKNSRATQLTTFVGNGYVGVVFVQGRTTKGQLDAFASAAYRNARAKLG